MLRALGLLALLAGSCAAMPAHAETTSCTRITSLPAVITTQGVYCLDRDLETAITSGAAITVNANNVTLDCNDRKIGGLQAGASTLAAGIVSSGRGNVTIRRCAVRGFLVGIKLFGTAVGGHLVEDNRLDFNTAIALQVDGDGNVVRRNRVFDTGGRPESNIADAIDIDGNGASVYDNTVNGMAVTGLNGFGSVYAFRILGNDHEFRNNLVLGLVSVGDGDARAFYGMGIATFRDNTIVGSGGQRGFALIGGSASSVCSGNRIHGFAQGIYNCVDLAGNVVN